MQMEEGLDTGAILAAEPLAIAPDETGGSLTRKMAERGGAIVPGWIVDLAEGRLKPRPQPSEGASYASKLTRAAARLDWRKAAQALEREVRAFDPWPVSWFLLGEERIKVLKARLANGAGAPGTVLGPGLTVACADGALRLILVQRPGRAALSDEAMVRGFAIPTGTVLP
jgi:methionyl-tRNA formyltransferase